MMTVNHNYVISDGNKEDDLSPPSSEEDSPLATKATKPPPPVPKPPPISVTELVIDNNSLCKSTYFV